MDQNTPEISIFVPCLNEAENIEGALDAILGAMADASIAAEILVVDDCSTDNTVEVVEAYQAAHPDAPIRLIRHATHQGLGINFAATAKVAQGKYYMLVNGDNVERREVIASLFGRLGEADIVIPYFGKLDRRPLSRIIVSRTFARLVNLLSGTKVHYYNGAVIHLRENVIAHHPGTSGFGYQAELITRLIRRGATYVELEIPMEERGEGTSSAFNIGNFLSVGGSLFRIAKDRLLTRNRSVTKGGRVRGCAVNLALIFASLVVIFLLLKVGDRAAATLVPPPRTPPPTGVIFPPGTEDIFDMHDYQTVERINSLGFRDNEVPIESTHEYRIMAIGDSFTYGWGVNLEDTWVKQLQSDLRARAIDAEVLNLGRPAAGPDEYVEIAAKGIPLLRPDLVIVCTLAADDLQQMGNNLELDDRVRRAFPNLTRIVTDARSADPDLPPPRVGNPEGSRKAYQDIARKIVDEMGPEQRAQFDALEAYVREVFYEGRLNPWMIGHSTGAPDYFINTAMGEDLGSRVDLFADDLRRIKRVADRWDAKLIVVSIPEGFLVNREAWENVQRIGFRVLPEFLGSPGADGAIAEACAEAGLDFFTVAEGFFERVDTKGLYLELDRHMTPAGNGLYADLITPIVTSALGLRSDAVGRDE